MKSLRSQLILSHVLPQLIILPLLGLSLMVIFESQFLLVELANNFRSVAMLAAQDAAARPAIWQDASQAEDFARNLSDSYQREIILIQPDGSIQAAPLGDTGESHPRFTVRSPCPAIRGNTGQKPLQSLPGRHTH